MRRMKIFRHSAPRHHREPLRILWLALVAIIWGGQALADTEIAQAEGWFNGLTTLEARFTQTASDGSVATGKFYLRRPDRSRFEFDAPNPLILITSGAWLHVDETDRRQVTTYPIAYTPIAAVLADTVRLTGDDFTTTAQTASGVIQVILDFTEGGGETDAGGGVGQLVLEFSTNPVELRRWVVVDANGVTTAVLLSNIVKGRDLSPRLFVPTRYPDARDR